MNKFLRHLLISVTLTFGASCLKAQPNICTNPALMTTFCADACIICDIDGFTGRHDSNVNGSLPAGFCTTVVHNSQWIGFIAGTTNLEIEMTVFNCRTGRGLEMTMYESRDCKTFTQVANCNTDAVPGIKHIFKNSTPLTIGQYYYLAMDGNADDDCNWTLKVLSGSTKVAPITTNATLIMPSRFCPNSSLEINVTPPLGATEFDWEIDGVKKNVNSKTIQHLFQKEGTYNVCVTPYNVCNKGLQICQIIIIERKITFVDTIICNNNCIKIAGVSICQDTSFALNLKAKNGCDSLVNYSVVKLRQPFKKIAITLCSDDTLIYGGKALNEPGEYDFYFKTNKCDSLVTIALSKQFCKVTGQISAINPPCFGLTNGKLRIAIPPSNNFPLFLTVTGIDNNYFLSNMRINTSNVLELLPGYNGLFVVTVTDLIGNIITKQVTLIPPPLLTPNYTLSSYNGFNVSCPDNKDGFIAFKPSGGTGSYRLVFDNKVLNDMSVKELLPKNYIYYLSDANGCEVSEIVTLKAPDSILFELQIIKPICSKPMTSTVIPMKLNEGAGNLIITTMNKTIDKSIDLLTGLHTFLATDINKCSTSKSIILDSLTLPKVNILAEQRIIELGDSILVSVENKLPKQINNYKWYSQGVSSCDKCALNEIWLMRSGIITLESTSKDGCTVLDTINVVVEKGGSHIAPNIIQANSDHTFFVQALKGVKSIQALTVYDRWGKKMGETNGETKRISCVLNPDLQAGIYLWIASVTFLDDTSETIKGNFLLIH